MPIGKKKSYSETSHSRNNQTRKYGNIKVEYKGIKFDSKTEVAIYKDLEILVEEGVIQSVCATSPEVEIFPVYKYRHTNGTQSMIRETHYRPDITIIDNNGKLHYIEVKSHETLTAVFIDKFKTLLHVKGIYLNVVFAITWKNKATVLEIVEGNYQFSLSKEIFQQRGGTLNEVKPKVKKEKKADPFSSDVLNKFGDIK